MIYEKAIILYESQCTVSRLKHPKNYKYIFHIPIFTPDHTLLCLTNY